MELKRFFVAPEDIDGNIVTLRGDEFNHITRVLRFKTGYKCIVCANDGIERVCTVDNLTRDSATLIIEDSAAVDRKKVRLTLYAGLLKNNKLDLVVQKAVELGVDKIVPFVSQNCAENRFNAERASKIALEAAKQCGAAYLTEIADSVNFDKVLSDIISYDTAVLAYEKEKKQSIKNLSVAGCNIALIVGPEGGFKSDEVSAAVAAGAKSVTLGRRILRAETADIVSCALLLDALGELDYD